MCITDANVEQINSNGLYQVLKSTKNPLQKYYNALGVDEWGNAILHSFYCLFCTKKSKRITFWRIMFCASFFCWYAFIRTCYFQANSCLFPGIPNESSFSRVVWRCFYGVLLTSLLAINSSVLKENVRGGAERCRSYIFVLAKSLLKYDMSWAGRDLEKQAGIASIAAAAQTLHRIRRLIAPKRYISSPTYSLLVSTTVHQWQKFKCQCLVCTELKFWWWQFMHQWKSVKICGMLLLSTYKKYQMRWAYFHAFLAWRKMVINWDELRL